MCFDQLWDSRFKYCFYDIYEKVKWPLHTSLFMHALPQFFEKGRRWLEGIGDWYVDTYHYDIHIYGLNDASHMLPMFVPNRMLIKEITYQTGVKGIAHTLGGGSEKL